MTTVNISVPKPPESAIVPEGTGFSNALKNATELGAAGMQTGNPYIAGGAAVIGLVKGLLDTAKLRKKTAQKDYLAQRAYGSQMEQINTEGAAQANASASGTGYFTNMYSAKEGGTIPEDELNRKIAEYRKSPEWYARSNGKAEMTDSPVDMVLLSGAAKAAGKGAGILASYIEKRSAQELEALLARKATGTVFGEIESIANPLLKTAKVSLPSIYGIKQFFDFAKTPSVKAEGGVIGCKSCGGKLKKGGELMQIGDLPKETVDLIIKLSLDVTNLKNKASHETSQEEVEETREPARKKFKIKYDEGGQLPEFRDGGQMNVIPKGVLHIHNNNIGDKGIPVVVEEESGALKKIAEIEKEELIFTLSVSEFLEQYAEKLDNDEITDEELLEVGKRLHFEITSNTIDKTKKLLADGSDKVQD